MRRAIGFLAALAFASPALASEPPLCTDRPTKANATCTVPAGTVQVETALLDRWRLDSGGERTRATILGSTGLKVGLSPRADLQLYVTPYARLESGGTRVEGIGDALLRAKWRVTADDAPVQVAAIPFVKLPIARRGLGNGMVEGGLAVQISTTVGRVTATLGPEVDLLVDADGSGRHASIVQLVNLAGPIARRLTLIGELWGSWNLDPTGTVRQASADVALAFAASEQVQIDLGANLGLTPATPDVEWVLGVSTRF